MWTAGGVECCVWLRGKEQGCSAARWLEKGSPQVRRIRISHGKDASLQYPQLVKLSAEWNLAMMSTLFVANSRLYSCNLQIREEYNKDTITRYRLPPSFREMCIVSAVAAWFHMTAMYGDKAMLIIGTKQHRWKWQWHHARRKFVNGSNQNPSLGCDFNSR